jgi:thioredoxin 1
MPAKRAVTETTFRAEVLSSTHLVLALFASRACAASRALNQVLANFVSDHDTQLRVAPIDVERSWVLAEQYGVEATPTLLVFWNGEVATRIVGFVPAGLLQVLIEQLRQGRLPKQAYWRPLEVVVEDTVILPLLQDAGLFYQRQVACQLPADSPRQRGRIDILVSVHPQAPPFTLIESKRLLRSPGDLALAVAQALPYARARCLPTFIVAAPSGLWLYQRDGVHFRLIQAASAFELQAARPSVIQAIRSLAGESDAVSPP